MGPRPHLWCFAFKTTTLASQILVSTRARPHLCFFHAKQRHYDLWSQTSPVILYMQNSVITIRNTSLHGSQTSPVILCMQNSVICARITSLHGSQTSPVVLCMQNNVRNTSLMCPSPHLLFLHAKQRD